jgi:hypothetical protein
MVSFVAITNIANSKVICSGNSAYIQDTSVIICLSSIERHAWIVEVQSVCVSDTCSNVQCKWLGGSRGDDIRGRAADDMSGAAMGIGRRKLRLCLVCTSPDPVSHLPTRLCSSKGASRRPKYPRPFLCAGTPRHIALEHIALNPPSSNPRAGAQRRNGADIL